jgi:hypothetical protein
VPIVYLAVGEGDSPIKAASHQDITVGEFIFWDDRDRSKFLGYLAEAKMLRFAGCPVAIRLPRRFDGLEPKAPERLHS